jgi:type II secretory pathway pseudopilin PulG
MSGRDGGGYAFLVEIMAVILFFALSATVIIALFVSADRRAKAATELSGAILAAGSAAEIVRASDAPEEDFIARYGAAPADGGYEAWLDASFQPGSFQQYILRLDCAQEDGLYEMTVTVERADGEAIYTLDCANYAGGGA